MLPNRQRTPVDYWRMIWRRKWLLVLCVMPIALGTAAYCFIVPSIYRSSAQIIVEEMQVPEKYIQAIVPAPMYDLRVSAQEITSKPWLERAARELGLLGTQQDSTAVEAFIEKMRRNIEVEVIKDSTSSKGKTAVFSISYIGEDRHAVALVANKITTMFIENAIKVREVYASQTTAFLDLELQEAREVVAAQEQKISDFNEQYMGELPEQRETNLKALDRLQKQLQATFEALEGVRNRKSLLRREGRSPQVTNDLFETEKAALIKQIGVRRLDLAALQRTFTQDYPDFSYLQEEIAALERRLATLQTSPQEAQPVQGAEEATNDSASREFQEELKEIKIEENLLLAQQADIQQQIEELEARVARIPQREQMLRMLIQDYENARNSYDSMQQRVHNARMSEKLENQQKGEQFRVVEPARVPIKPEKSDRGKILVMGLALGLALGCGAVLLAEQRDHTFRAPEDLNRFTTLPVLATIPQLTTTVKRRQQQRRKIHVGIAYVLILVASVVGVRQFWMPINVVYARPWQQFTFSYAFKPKPPQGLILYFGFEDKPDQPRSNHSRKPG